MFMVARPANPLDKVICRRVAANGNKCTGHSGCVKGWLAERAPYYANYRARPFAQMTGPARPDRAEKDAEEAEGQEGHGLKVFHAPYIKSTGRLLLRWPPVKS